MARISVYYDKDLKERFFMVRGDEAYTRSTKTLLNFVEGSISQGEDSFSARFKVNVLRDRDNGQILIYDNDALIYEIDDWTDTSNETTITLTNLNYDINHNIYAKYTGNSKCNASSSETYTIYQEDTNRYSTSLTLDNTIQYNPSATVTKIITLSSAGASGYKAGQTIDVYYDDLLLTSVTTDSNGQATFDLPVGNVGLHTINVRYGGSRNLYSSSKTQKISVGYKLEILTYPAVIVNSSSQEYSALFTNYLGTPQTTKMVNWQYLNGDTWVNLKSGTTDSKGIVTMSVRGMSDSFRFEGYVDSVTTHSEEITTNYIIPDSVSITSSSPAFYKNQPTTLSMNVSDDTGSVIKLENIPFVLSGETSQTVYSGNTGTAILTMNGDGLDDKTFNVSVGNVSQSVTYKDYLQYWDIQNNINRSYLVSNSTVQDLNSYYRLQIPANTIGVFLINKIVGDADDYTLEIASLTSSSKCRIDYCSAKNNNGQIIVGSYHIPSSDVIYSQETWKIVKQSGTVYVYRNGTLYESFTSQDGYDPAINIYNLNTSTVNISFTSLTLRGVVE